jgi:hypothetical protein
MGLGMRNRLALDLQGVAVAMIPTSQYYDVHAVQESRALA